MEQAIERLYQVILDRKKEPTEGSYTCYLFEKGLDKILKKVGEESAETIIAAKNQDKNEVVMEVSDLLYHVLVLLAQQEIPLDLVLSELDARGKKIGNLKAMKETDHST